MNKKKSSNHPPCSFNQDNFFFVKIVTRNYLMDLYSSILNFLGLNLKPYEKKMDNAITEIQKEMEKLKISKNGWYRYEISTIAKEAIIIMCYGKK